MMTSKAIYKQRNGLGGCKQVMEGGGDIVGCKKYCYFSGVDPMKMSFAWGVVQYQCALKAWGGCINVIMH